MIYLVHGTDLARSRVVIQNQIEKLGIKDKHELAVEDVSPEKLLTLLSTQSMFGSEPLVHLNVTAKSDITNFIPILSKILPSSTLIILSPSKLPKTNALIKESLKFKIKVIESDKKINSNIFAFVDALFSQNRKRTYQEFLNLKNENTDYFYILSMILYQLRNLTHSVFKSKTSESFKPFQISKVSDMSKLYPQNKLKDLYSFLYITDLHLKTGQIDSEIAILSVIEKVLN